MLYQNNKKLLGEFTALHNSVLFHHDDILAWGLCFDDQGALEGLRIRVRGGASSNLASLLPTKWVSEESATSLAVEIVETEPYVAHASAPAMAPPVPSGSRASGTTPSTVSGSGTLGWCLVLDGVPVALSNWHVIAGDGWRPGRLVHLDDRPIARLVTARIDEQFDLAIAAFQDPSDLGDQFRQCPSGERRPHPNRLAFDIRPGETHYKVGARAPICRTHKLRGQAYVRVRFHDGRVRTFSNQLMFGKMTDPGDSGAIVVHQDTNEVVGLNFAGNNVDTVANPLLDMPWSYVGTRMIESTELPAFETTAQQLDHGGALHDVHLGEDASAATKLLEPPTLRTAAIPYKVGDWVDLNGVPPKGKILRVRYPWVALQDMDRFGWLNVESGVWLGDTTPDRINRGGGL